MAIIVRIAHPVSQLFTATVSYNNQLITGVGTQKRYALRSLEHKLTNENGIKVLPEWEILEWSSIIPSEVLAVVSESMVVTKEETNFFPEEEPQVEDVSYFFPEDTCVSESFKAPIPRNVLPKTDCGLITPSSSLDTWVHAYELAENIAVDICSPQAERDYGIGNIQGSKKDDWKTRYRTTVNMYMEEQGCVPAFDRTPSGKTWLQIAKELGGHVRDNTISAFRAGEGAGREMNHKTISGNIVSLNIEDAFGKIIDVGSSPTKIIDPETKEVIEEQQHEVASDTYYRKQDERALWGKFNPNADPMQPYNFPDREVMLEVIDYANKARAEELAHGATRYQGNLRRKQAYCERIRELELTPHYAWEADLKHTRYPVYVPKFRIGNHKVKVG